MMDNYAYTVVAEYADCEVTVKTYTKETAILALLDYFSKANVMLVDNSTGEICIMKNHKECYIANEWYSIILEYLMKSKGRD